jgi:hypothetical protein
MGGANFFPFGAVRRDEHSLSGVRKNGGGLFWGTGLFLKWGIIR